MTAPTRSPMIGADRFPVDVREVARSDAAPDGLPAELRHWRQVRAILTVADGDLEPTLYVWSKRGDPALETVWDRDTSTVGSRRVPWRIETAQGTFIVEHRGGCASCGSRISTATWDPFPSMRAAIGAFR